jgi:hypothetical protein
MLVFATGSSPVLKKDVSVTRTRLIVVATLFVRIQLKVMVCAALRRVIMAVAWMNTAAQV